MIMYPIVTFAYIVCGIMFFKPVHKDSYLSALSIIIVNLLILVYLKIQNSLEVYIFYLFINPVYADFVIKIRIFSQSQNGTFIGLVISALIPSMLLCIGMFLSEIFAKKA